MTEIDAATVVCLRRSRGTKNTSPIEDFQFFSGYPGECGDIFSALKFLPQDSEWEVLMGQSEVKNWLRSTPEKLVIMRYPGEYKFPGGTRDQDEYLHQTALRELHEEFGIGSKDAKLRLFNVRKTKYVKGKSYIMHNFVAIAEDPQCQWLNDVKVDQLNSDLAKKRELAQEAIKDGSFWTLPEEQRVALSPEVHRIEWLNLRTAVWYCSTTLIGNNWVNSWQQEEFKKYGLSSRDPMYQTMMTLLEIERYTPSALLSHCQKVDLETEAFKAKETFRQDALVFPELNSKL